MSFSDSVGRAWYHKLRLVSVMVLGLINVQNFWMPDSSMGKNAIIFEVDMSSSVPINNKKKDILMIGKGLTQGLDDTTLTAELNIQLIFQDQIENFV